MWSLFCGAAAVVQDVDSIFDVDTILALRSKVCELSGKEYKKELVNGFCKLAFLLSQYVKNKVFLFFQLGIAVFAPLDNRLAQA